MEEWILARFTELAWHPWKAYGLMVVLLVSASFGQPLPEEVTLVSAGLLAYMASNDPPPYRGAVGVDVHLAALVCFVAILGADLCVYWLGHRYGAVILRWRWLRRFLPPERLERATSSVRRRGYIAAAVFRFTPGLRFPGFFACGMLGLSIWKFTLADGLMALLTVPTQIYLVHRFGNVVRGWLKLFNGALAVLAIVVVVVFVGWHLWQRRSDRRAPPVPAGFDSKRHSSLTTHRSATASEPSGESSTTR